MTTHKINVHDIKNGQILIYQRSDHKGGVWQADLSVPGSTGSVARSLRTRDLDEAKRLTPDRAKNLSKSTFGKTRKTTRKPKAPKAKQPAPLVHQTAVTQPATPITSRGHLKLVSSR